MLFRSEIELVATCDLRQEAASSAAEKFSAKRHYTDYQQMFDEEVLDGVVIAAPPSVHTEIGVEALNRGCMFLRKSPHQ